MLVTLELAKKHLVVEHDDDNQLITAYIAAASELVEQYINRDYVQLVSGSEGESNAPAPVVAAVLILVATIYARREEDQTNAPPMTMPSTVRFLLAPYRDFGCPDGGCISEGSGT
ncbi:phage gp6-like head-tail connector protein [Sinorhizobium meliloti]|uniref:head-tail connector protein n=1 Tax=Rhizobium meliloti TaxID=382 RepID=UPI0023807578|nr:head-tail connector protein [Sinorhizobium meliloti]MDE3797603.1 phage gp6-like head-tail connector protein [Sinorhizobium meliloti]